MRKDREETDDMLPEYDYSKGVRGKYAPLFKEDSFRSLNLVSLDADVHAVFPDSEAVNNALRVLIAEKHLAKAS